ncbi:MAG TPA: selenium metabolism-associated LysR family transcriptional regulator [Dissulfurispiraceae bacterium]|nr:selenium metabolism-associated LysR family transcriptional regulator [Dissulfurispiraceae bacterium]
MDIHQLRIFVSVYKNRSFSRASEQLYLTQPTISDHIKALEEEFGCRLFDRLGRTIMPTKEAEALYGHAVEIIEKANAVKEVIGQFGKEPSGELVIGASTIPGTYLLPPVMASFQKKYPSISFQIVIADSREVVQKVLSHELLLGIVGSKLDNSQIVFAPLIEDELIVVASPNFTKKESMTFQQLAALPMVLREEGSGTRKEIERIFSGKGLSLDAMNIAGLFGSTDSIKQAVKAGMGVSILSRLSVRDELKYKILKEIRLVDLQMKRNFYVITHKKRTLPAAYTLFSNHLINESKHS